MSLHALSEEQKTHFFDLAQQMIVANGMVAEPEVAYLNRLYWEAGFLGRGVLGDVDAKVDLAIFNTRKVRLVVVVELIIISIIDGNYHPDEAAFADGLVAAFGLSPDDHAELCRVAEDAAGALSKMHRLVG